MLNKINKANTKTLLKRIFTPELLCLIALYAICNPAMAAAYGDAPWDNALCWFVNVLRGRTAFAIATIAFIAVAAGFMWGEQLTGIMKTMVNIFVAVCIMLGSTALVTRIADMVGDISLRC